MRETDQKLANALGNDANKYMSLNASVVPKHYAPNSKFYEQVMEDGYVFNPFIHRRWLPAQYKRMVRSAAYDNRDISQMIRRWYTYAYEIKFTVEEIDKMLTLQRHDPDAFDERKQFFTFDIAKEVLQEHMILVVQNMPKEGANYFYLYILKDANIHLQKYAERTERLFKGYFGYSKTMVYDWEPVRMRLMDVQRMINKAKTYYDLKRAIRKCPEAFQVDSGYSHPLNGNWVEAFWRSGAYYSIKNALMFEGASLEGTKGAFACFKLKEMINRPAKELHEVYQNLGEG